MREGTFLDVEPLDDDDRRTNILLHELGHRAIRLRTLGLSSAVMTFVEVAAVLAAVGVLPLRVTITIAEALPTIVVGIGGVALMLLVVYDTTRKRGDALFEELSDELQWNVVNGSQGGSKPGPDRERPPVDVRVRLRDYARATDLPFVPGRFGAAAYAAIDILMILVLALPYLGRRP
jgi:hypothetical protein